MNFFRDENFLLYVPLAVWIAGIFYLSSNRGSIANTLPFFMPALNRLFPGANAGEMKRRFYVVRKLGGHFTGYAVLALLASIVFYNSSLVAAARVWYACAFAVVLIVAATDETGQHFSSHRVGSVSDVALDCAGGLTMIFLFWLFAARGF